MQLIQTPKVSPSQAYNSVYNQRDAFKTSQIPAG